MRKIYPLHVDGRHPDRVLDAVKHDIRKYLKRERRRELPAGVDFWDFDCRVGQSRDSAETVHLAALIGQIDAAARDGQAAVYVEILAKHGHRQARPERAAVATASTDEAQGDEAA